MDADCLPLVVVAGSGPSLLETGFDKYKLMGEESIFWRQTLTKESGRVIVITQ